MTDLHILFGGTFNPPHKGHLSICQQLMHALPVAQVTYIPCFEPVHKTTNISSQHRHLMLELALKPFAAFDIGLWELNQKRPCYAIETIHHYQTAAPCTKFVWLIGSDQDLTQWKDWQQILSKLSIIRVNRSTPPPPIAKRLKHRVTTDYTQLYTPGSIWQAPFDAYEISSSEIRETGPHTHHLVPKAVREYIHQHSLYTE